MYLVISMLTTCRIFKYITIIHFSLAEQLDASFSNTMFAHLTMTSIICASLEKQFIEVVEEIAPKFEILKFCVLG